MKYKYNIAISLALVFLLLLVPSFVLVAAQESDGWHRYDYAPTDLFNHTWTGTLWRTEGSIQFWQLYAELPMMPGMGMDMGMGGDIEWVIMLIQWDPSAQKGQIEFLHNGYNLRFTGWKGIIEFGSPVLHFNVSGQGLGYYRENGIWYHLIINGSYAGNFTPVYIDHPFVGGNSTCTERAILYYGDPLLPTPVGGEVIQVNRLAVLAPWMVIAIAAITMSTIVLSKRKLFLH